MITQFQKFLAEKTHGVIHTRKEAIYIITIGILIIILSFSLIARMFV